MIDVNNPEDKSDKVRKKDEPNFTVKDKIEQRREDVYIQRLKGFEIQEIAEQQGVSPSTIEKDLRNFKSSMSSKLQRLRKKGFHEAFYAAITQFDMVLGILWQMADKEDQSRNKQKILESIRDTAKEKYYLWKDSPNFEPTVKEILDRSSFMSTFNDKELGLDL